MLMTRGGNCRSIKCRGGCTTATKFFTAAVTEHISRKPKVTFVAVDGWYRTPMVVLFQSCLSVISRMVTINIDDFFDMCCKLSKLRVTMCCHFYREYAFFVQCKTP